jgi:hypothetical protein
MLGVVAVVCWLGGDGDGFSDVRLTGLAWDWEDRKRFTREGFIALTFLTVTLKSVSNRETICCLVSISTYGLVRMVPALGCAVEGVINSHRVGGDNVAGGEQAATEVKDLTLPPFWTLN